MIDTLTILVLELANVLKEQRLMLATAESCTGGGLSYWLTSIPGSSDWFDRGFVTYSNAAKMEMIDVNPETLGKFGAVSEETVREMAEGALTYSQADVSIAISGIAGPDGGTDEKPVGTVWFGYAKKNHWTDAEMHQFSGNREMIRVYSIEMALKRLLVLLTKARDATS